VKVKCPECNFIIDVDIKNKIGPVETLKVKDLKDQGYSCRSISQIMIIEHGVNVSYATVSRITGVNKK